jgi:hypothetical protein
MTAKKSVIKCDKCDVDGYIPTGPGARKSCECGWAISLQAQYFEGATVVDLVSFLNIRNDHKLKDND